MRWKEKDSFFYSIGEVSQEIRYPLNMTDAVPLENGKFLVIRHTTEKGLHEDEYVHDVFTSDGVYFARESLKSYGKLGWNLEPLSAVARNGRLYCLQEKESGDKELVVYKIRWEEKD